MKQRTAHILLFGALLAFLPATVTAATGSVRVIVTIDGLSDLLLSGNSAQWHHIEYSPPETTVINGVSWTPTGLSSFCNCLSDIFSGVEPPIPQSARDFSVTWSGRGTVSLEELPSASNGFRLRVRFDDVAPGGADEYDALISYQYAEPIPMISRRSMGLLSLLLIALTVLVLRRQFS